MKMTIRWAWLGVVGAMAPMALAQSSSIVQGEVLVKFRPGREVVSQLVHASFGAEAVETIERLGVQRVRIAPGVSVDRALRSYRRNPNVLFAEANRRYQRFLDPNDPLFSEQYGAQQMRMPEAWGITIGSPDLIIAIIDDGVDLTHPDLAAAIVPGFDYSDNDSDPSPAPGDYHGTHVAGIAGAIANNNLGVAGMAWNVKIMPLKIFPNATAFTSAAAIIHAADNGASIVNMSYGGYGAPNATEQQAIEYAASQDVLLVSAAGNFNTDFPAWPNGFEEVISVGATGRNGLKANYSDFGERVDVAAPGTEIISTVTGGIFAEETGTSMSSPGVAGALALLRAHAPTLTAVEIRFALESTAVPIGGWLQHGRVDIYAALRAARRVIEVNSDPTAVAVHEGTHVSGALASLLTSDDVRFVTSSANINRLGHAASIQATIPMTSVIEDVRGAALRVESSSVRQATLLAYLWDFTSNRWVSLRQSAGSATDGTRLLDLGRDLSRYVANGEMRVVLRALWPQRTRPVAYQFQVDHLRLEMQVLEPENN